MSKKQNNSGVKAILLDLGKVLIDFDFTPAFKKISRHTGHSHDSIKSYFSRSGIEVLYDGGRLSSKEFYLLVKKGLGHSLTFKQFKDIWNDIFTLHKPMANLVEKLHKNYRLVLISNTNRMHYEHLKNNYAVLRRIRPHILSFKEKIRKPDARIYRRALKACRAKPHEVLYVDDRQDLTEAARELGFHVFTYKKNTSDLKARMRELGIRL